MVLASQIPGCSDVHVVDDFPSVKFVAEFQLLPNGKLFLESNLNEPACTDSRILLSASASFQTRWSGTPTK